MPSQKGNRSVDAVRFREEARTRVPLGQVRTQHPQAVAVVRVSLLGRTAAATTTPPRSKGERGKLARCCRSTQQVQGKSCPAPLLKDARGASQACASQWQGLPVQLRRKRGPSCAARIDAFGECERARWRANSPCLLWAFPRLFLCPYSTARCRGCRSRWWLASKRREVPKSDEARKTLFSLDATSPLRTTSVQTNP